MTTELQQLASTIATLEAQRALLGDAPVDAVIAPLRARIAELRAQGAQQAPSEPAAAAAPEQTLRQVSVLFLDIVGSTALSQHLDPEDIHAVMDAALAACTTIVEAHHGKVLQYAGDSLLAVFGAAEAHEDDAECAVRAGLALLEEGRRQGGLVALRHGHDGFNVRLGVHTGGVLLGGGVDDEGTIRGMTVNVAARMEQTAPPGALRISHDTYRQVRGLFDLEPQPPMLVKGRDEPIVTYLVRSVRPRTFRVAARGIEGIDTRMVGREAELAALQRAFEQLFVRSASTAFSACTVVAEAGVGKSRLLHEFEAWAGARPEAFSVFRGRATPQTQTQPYGLLRDILAWRFQINDGDTMELAKRKLEEGIAPLFEADDGAELAQAHAHLLGHLIGLDFQASRHIQPILADSRQIRSRGFHAAAQMFRRVHLRSNAPVLLLLDDLHWADEPSLDFLATLAPANADLPMLVIGLARPTLFERRADVWGGAEAQRVDLAPLGAQGSRDLAAELLKKLTDAPAVLRELIISRAEGNPFYMEELVLMLIDEGAIDTTTEPWKVVADRLLATPVPATLTGVLQARLDSLHAVEKLALQQASVIGFVFWDRALAAIDAHAVDALPAVARRDLVVSHEEGHIDDAREYAFRHPLLHHVTYETVLKRVRREGHARTAAWLAGLGGARANDFLGATAEHFEKGGDARSACEYYTRAAEHAATRFAHDALLGHAGHALSLADSLADSLASPLADPQTQADAPAGVESDTPAGAPADRALLAIRWRLHAVRERALDLQGVRAGQAADIDALERIADALDDDTRRADAAWRRCDILLRTGEFPACEAAARAAMALAERVGTVEIALRAQQRLVLSRTFQGDHASARTLGLSGMAQARARGLREIEARFTNALAVIASNQGDLLALLQFAEQGLAISREIGDRRTESIELCNLGTTLLDFGAHTRAAQLFDEGLLLTRACGIRASEAVVLANLAELALREGNAAQAHAHAQAALTIATAVQDPGTSAFAAFLVGEAALALGEPADAARAFAQARDGAHAVGDAVEFYALAGLARVALACGDAAEAHRIAEALLQHFTAEGDPQANQNMLIRLTCHRAFVASGDARAINVLATAHAALLARAATVDDLMLREGFLTQVPEHRAIVAAWAAQQASGAGVSARERESTFEALNVPPSPPGRGLG